MFNSSLWNLHDISSWLSDENDIEESISSPKRSLYLNKRRIPLHSRSIVPKTEYTFETNVLENKTIQFSGKESKSIQLKSYVDDLHKQITRKKGKVFEQQNSAFLFTQVNCYDHLFFFSSS